MTPTPATQPGFLVKLLTLVASVFLLVLGFMFSVVFLAVIAIAGLLAWAYFWWKTRELRKAMKEAQSADGHVIDGEAIVIDISGERESDVPFTKPPAR